ncbi:MAG: hypothetical protein NE334_12730 [Lentisphaeraceae bacterium]|nr:hypothetical protein [Lentisphaeraceae bacterium]
MHPDELKKAVEEILQRDKRFCEDAYFFMNEAVLFSAEYFSKPEFGNGRHLSGPELLDGIREFTLSEFGTMSFSVLRRWGVQTTLDIGHIIFNLIDARILSASPEDKLGDFNEVYDFHSAFVKPFEPENENPAPLKKIDLI